MALLWSIALVAAVLWPGRLVGPLDGAPLDAPFEAILIGMVLPTLWVLAPGFLRGGMAKALVVVLLAWKIATALLLTQGGWCGEFATPYPPPGGHRLDRSWDLRTYFGPPPPACSAIVARAYGTLADFPAWSINAPIDEQWIMGFGPATVPTETPRPPAGAYKMVIEGWMRPAAAGTLTFDLGETVEFEGSIDGTRWPMQRGGRVSVPVAAGEHAVSVSLGLGGDRWRFVPRWGDRDLFTAVATTVAPATTADRMARRWGSYVTPLLILILLGLWIKKGVWSLFRPWAEKGSRPVFWWIVGSMAVAAVLGLANRDAWVRWAVVGLAGATLVSMPPRLRNWRGAVLLFGLPWLTVFAVRSIPQVGRFTIFSQGDDWLTFQQFAYRIFMRGRWLQGGEPTFWYQPLYRWTTGVFHLVFGDSSVGDLYWDAFGLLIGALFAFEIANRVAGFRAAIFAATLMLATLTLGPNWYVIGRGLSEISASAWLFLAALSLMKARTGALRYGAYAGACGILAFYTRLNHLPLAIALVALLWPLTIPAGAWTGWRTLWRDLSKSSAVVYLSCIAGGLVLFASRTWYYTGHFSVFAGTTRGFNGTGLGVTMDSMWSAAAWRRGLESVMMIVTVQDPPRFDPRSVLVVAGVCCAVLGLLRVPPLRRIPLGLALVCLAAIAGGLVARGIAYPGRFSIHLIPLAVATSIVSAAAAIESLQDHGAA